MACRPEIWTTVSTGERQSLPPEDTAVSNGSEVDLLCTKISLYRGGMFTNPRWERTVRARVWQRSETELASFEIVIRLSSESLWGSEGTEEERGGWGQPERERMDESISGFV